MAGKGVKWFAAPAYRLIEPVVQLLIRLRVHPNTISTMGFLVTIGAGIFYHLDHVRWAGLFVIFGGIADIFDGRVARLSGLASKFGAFYDSTLDRISEIVVFLGLASLYNTMRPDVQDLAMIYVILLAMGGSLMVSYTRAKAEALGLDCTVGFAQRGERIVLLGGGSLLFGLAWDGMVLDIIIILLAVISNLTAIQRIVWVYKHGMGVPLDGLPVGASSKNETTKGRN